MEDSHGKIGIDVEVFGPYTMAGEVVRVRVGDRLQLAGGESGQLSLPAGYTCNRNIRTDGGNAWRAAIGCASGLCGFDNAFYVTAGHDESSTWQEFGEMLWTDRDQVPAKFGPPGAEDGPVLNAARQSDAELGPDPLRALDVMARCGEPLAERGRRDLDAGGELRPERLRPRVQPPARAAGQLQQPVRRHRAELHRLLGDDEPRDVQRPGRHPQPLADPEPGRLRRSGRTTCSTSRTSSACSTPDDQVTVERNTLQAQGVAVVDIKARESVPDGDMMGLTVNFGDGGDLAGTCANQGYVGDLLFYCPNRSGSYLHYRVEVVDRVGNDSFAPGHGVLITKSRNSGTPRVWMIDPNPQDIGMIDFYRPDGTPVAVVRGDPRQLNDATFQAGTRSGSEYEYVDTFNKLHFYVLGTRRDADGVLHYAVAVRRVGEGDPFTRGIALAAPTKTPQREGFLATCTFPLTNTGQAGAAPFDQDVYRVSASSSSPDWKVTLPNALAAAKAGATVQVPVHVLRDPLTDDGDARTTVTLTAKSEADSSKTATRTCAVHVRDTTPGGISRRRAGAGPRGPALAPPLPCTR